MLTRVDQCVSDASQRNRAPCALMHYDDSTQGSVADKVLTNAASTNEERTLRSAAKSGSLCGREAFVSPGQTCLLLDL